MVPNLGDGNLLKLCCHGDGLTVERGRDARRARRGGETPWTRLEGLEVVPQEFHKRGIYLQASIPVIHHPILNLFTIFGGLIRDLVTI